MTYDRKRFRLLVAHEGVEYVEGLRDIAEMNDHLYDVDILHCDDGELVFGLVSSFQPSIVLLDAHLLECGAIALIEQLRDVGTPVVVTSTYSSGEIENSALQNGASGYCQLSEDPEVLDIVLQQLADFAEYRTLIH